MIKMRPGGKLPLLKDRAMHFMLAFLFLSAWKALAMDSFDMVHVAICEYEDANLTWHNTTHHEKMSKAVHKEQTLVAHWPEGMGFNEGPRYKGRLIEIGETAFMIMKANRSDNGVYNLTVRDHLTNNISEASIYLLVIVPPTNQCIPHIIQKGNYLVANNLQEGCGIPRLIPKWMNGTKMSPSGNISVLNLESTLVPGMYTACAFGESICCFKGDVDELCSHYTALPSQNKITFVLVVTTVAVVICIVIGSAFFLVLRRRFLQRKKNEGSRFSQKENHSENGSLMKMETQSEVESNILVPANNNSDTGTPV